MRRPLGSITMKMTKIIFYPFLAIFCLTIATNILYAQRDSSDYRIISGFVILESDSNYLSSATVEILELHLTYSIDYDGKFVIRNIPPGTYTLRVTSGAMDTVIIPTIVIPRCDNPLIIMMRWVDICHDAAKQARMHLANGRIYLRSSGLRIYSPYERQLSALRSKYGFQSWDTGCVMNDECDDQYNSIVMIYLNLRNGKDWQKRFQQEVDSIRNNPK
jgi:hypothetical protein